VCSSDLGYRIIRENPFTSYIGFYLAFSMQPGAGNEGNYGKVTRH
jgi:hypothetical protein